MTRWSTRCCFAGNPIAKAVSSLCMARSSAHEVCGGAQVLARAVTVSFRALQQLVAVGEHGLTLGQKIGVLGGGRVRDHLQPAGVGAQAR